MTTFSIPNHPANPVNAAAYAPQSYPDKVDYDSLAGGFAQNGVVSGCVVAAHGPEDQGVAVSAGTIILGGTQTALGAVPSLALSAAHATLPRHDLIVASAGGFAVIDGVAHALAPFPNYNLTTQVSLAAVYRPPAFNNVFANQLTPKRVVILPWAGGGGGGGAPTTADYLIGTANGALPSAIVVGAAPGGELGGTWAAPTVDTVHAGSAHHVQQHALSDAAHHTGAITAAQHPQIAVGDLHPEYQTPAEHTAIGDTAPHHAAAHALQSADHSGGISTTQHGALLGPASAHRWGDIDKTTSALADITTRPHSALSDAPPDAHHAQSHTLASHTGTLDHGTALTGLADDDHTQYVLRSILTTNGDIFVRLAGVVDRQAVGANDTYLGVTGGLPAWRAQSTISHDSIGGVSADDHHAQAHVLATGTALGADHTISGAAAGEVLRALSATTAAFDQLQHTDLGTVLPDQHHAQAHAIGGADHSGTLDHGATGDLTADDHTQYVLRSILTTNGDIYVRLSGTVSRLAVGAASSYLGVVSGLPAWRAQGTISHSLIGGLTADNHTQYALLAGRAGGQTLFGGDGSGEALILQDNAVDAVAKIELWGAAPHVTITGPIIRLGTSEAIIEDAAGTDQIRFNVAFFGGRIQFPTNIAVDSIWDIAGNNPRLTFSAFSPRVTIADTWTANSPFVGMFALDPTNPYDDAFNIGIGGGTGTRLRLRRGDRTGGDGRFVVGFMDGSGNDSAAIWELGDRQLALAGSGSGAPGASLLIGAIAAPEAGYALELRDDFLLGAFFQELREISDPSAPAAGGARFYVRDTGGKTEAVIRFNTGTIRPVAIED